jgi:hypothetical protein
MERQGMAWKDKCMERKGKAWHGMASQFKERVTLDKELHSISNLVSLMSRV